MRQHVRAQPFFARAALTERRAGARSAALCQQATRPSMAERLLEEGGFPAGPAQADGDPFSERPTGRRFLLRRQILGGCFRFGSDSAALLQLVEAAYAGLPAHQLTSVVPTFDVELRLLPRQPVPIAGAPPQMQVQSGAGLIIGVTDASNYVVLAPGQHRALVVASEDMLARPYHLRYELIEFAVFTLATRGQGLVPLHGACVGRHGCGVLVLGPSGAGKSTLALHSLLQGLDFLAEDAVFVQPDSLFATGVANYLHVQADALRGIDDVQVRRWISQSPIIRRRSGAEKFEADLRQGHGQLAATPLRVVGAVFVCGESADDPAALLSPLPADEIAARLSADQAYAAAQPGWRRFAHQMQRLGVHELRRGLHPRDGAEALRRLLG
jgi:hypothetical protein